MAHPCIIMGAALFSYAVVRVQQKHDAKVMHESSIHIVKQWLQTMEQNGKLDGEFTNPPPAEDFDSYDDEDWDEDDEDEGW